jgi:Protein of unknown function (DUF4238)
VSGPTQPAAFDFLKTIMPGVAPELQPVLTLAYDIDSFEKDAPMFAAQIGVPVDELIELAAEARIGSDPSSDKRPKQHVVSRSLLAGFSTGTSRRAGDQKIWPYSFADGRETLIDPTRVGVVPDFVKVDSKRTEQRWEEVETSLRDTVGQLETSPDLRDPVLIDKVKKIVALHWARSIETLEAVEATYTSMIVDNKTALLRQPELLDQLYQLKTGDHSAVLADSARIQFVDQYLSRFEWIFTSGTWFRFDVIYFFRRSMELLDRLSVQVLRAPAGSEFLIGDTPVVKLDENGERRGVMHPIQIGNATTVLMPLTPRFMVALNSLTADHTVTVDEVRKYNTWQLDAARERVFMHPTATGLMDWVEKTRAPTKAS